VLAWQRTGVGGTALGVTVLLLAVHQGAPVLVGAAALGTAACAAAVGIAGAAARPGRYHTPGSAWIRLLATAGVPILLAILGVLSAVTTARV
jgi:hypothetical protein